MRIVRWLVGIMAGVILLVVAAVVIVTVFVDPNRFKGRIERMVQDATGQPFAIRGDLDIAWYPWLALQMGPAQVGADPALAQWQSAQVGVKLIPLMQGRLIVSTVRLDGLKLHLQHAADGQSNWQTLLAKKAASGTGRPPPEIDGIEIRNGAVEYADAQSGMRITLSALQLDMSEWKPGKPVTAQTQFKLPSGAQFNISLNLNGMEPLRAQGALSVETTSLRNLLSDLNVAGPRPRDSTTLSAFKLKTQWTASAGAIAAKPIELQLDQTNFTGELIRTSGPNAILTFSLKGDRIALDRYTDLDDTDSAPFELPTEALRALRAQGVLSFNEAQLAGAQMKNVRLRLELKDGHLHEP